MIGDLLFTRKSPALSTTRGFHQTCLGTAVERLAELFSGLFYVAASRFNSPRFVMRIETPALAHVKLAFRCRSLRTSWKIKRNQEIPFDAILLSLSLYAHSG